MFLIVVWFNPNKKTYYYKIVKGYYKRYFVGYRNSYDHEVILIIPLKQEIFYKQPLLKKVLMRIISFLQNIEKNI